MRIPRILHKQIKEKYDISRNTFIRKDKGKKAEEREIEIGDIHSDIFQPQVKLKQWEECNFSVRLKHDETNPKIETDGDKIKWKGEKVEAHFYETKIGKKTDAFELEVLLKSKPKTNKVKMSIRTKGLKFYYQPPLNEEKHEPEVVKSTPTDCYDKDGNVICHRPENVVGSYAVYHESKAGDYSKMGKKNYRAGKAFHIYRPKIIDSAGKEVWGKLNIDEKKKLLTVEIPQEFLDKAVYPVIVDPTFGYETAGGSYTEQYDGFGSHFEASEAGTVDSLTFYGRAVGSFYETAWGAVYEKTGKGSGTRVGYTQDVEMPAYWDSPNWKTATWDTGGDLVGGTNYWLAWGQHEGSATKMRFYYDTGVTDQGVKVDANPESGWDESFSMSNYTDTKKFSIYCTYTAGGGTTVVKDIIQSGIIPFPR